MLLNDILNVEAEISKSVCATFYDFKFQNRLRNCLNVLLAASGTVTNLT
jgi:hypothetical protein